MNLKFDNNGLIPVITQDYITKEVLMFAFMNEEAFNLTKESGRVHYYSRSRQKLWLKGEESGNFQNVKNIMYDCDEDCLLVMVEQVGGACHTGHKSCFYRELGKTNETSPIIFDPSKIYKKEDKEILTSLYDVILDRKGNPKEGSYTNYLFEKGIDKTLKKVGEESSEVIIACKNNNTNEVVYEISDLMYHLTVLMVQMGVDWQNIFTELEKRSK